MKRFLPYVLLLAATLFTFTAFSQSTTGKIEYQKGDKISATLELPYSSDIVQGGIREYLSKKSTKSDRSKGFDIYRYVKLNADDAELSDVHVKVVSKGSRKDPQSVVYLLLGRPGENVGLRTPDDNLKNDEAKTLLNDLVPAIEAYKLETDIKEQEDMVSKQEKKLGTLVEDQKDMEKKVKTLQDKIEQNKADQKKQSDEAARQHTLLENLRGKRKSG
jgi:hypothetical protein